MTKWKLRKIKGHGWLVISPTGQGSIYSGTWQDGLRHLWRDIKMNPHLCDQERERKQKDNG